MTTSTRTYVTKTSRLTKAGYVYNEAAPAESWERAVDAVIGQTFACVERDGEVIAMTDITGTVHVLRPF